MLSQLARLARCRRGMAAVEFALIAPVMIAMFFGVVEISEALSCRARVTRMASTAADLVAQSPSVSTADLTNIFNSANAVLYPYSPTPAKIIITSVISDGKGGVKVDWSVATANATAHANGSAVPVAANLIPTNGSVIYAEISYDYTSTTTQVIKTPLTMTGSFVARPRRALIVAKTT